MSSEGALGREAPAPTPDLSGTAESRDLGALQGEKCSGGEREKTTESYVHFTHHIELQRDIALWTQPPVSPPAQVADADICRCFSPTWTGHTLRAFSRGKLEPGPLSSPLHPCAPSPLISQDPSIRLGCSEHQGKARTFLSNPPSTQGPWHQRGEDQVWPESAHCSITVGLLLGKSL